MCFGVNFEYDTCDTETKAGKVILYRTTNVTTAAFPNFLQNSSAAFPFDQKLPRHQVRNMAKLRIKLAQLRHLQQR